MRSPFSLPRIRTIAAAVVLTALSSGCSEQSPTALRGFRPADANGDRSTPQFEFSTIDAPGSRLTSAQGINADGVVSGWYVDLQGRTHGFMLAEGVLTTINYPGADNTDVRGIGPDGTLVGTHWNIGEEAAAFHGFKRSPTGEFSTVRFEGHLYEIPQRILPDGTILGCRHDHDLMASMRGITISPTDGASEIDTFASMNNGATPSGKRTIGLYTNMMTNLSEAYVMENETFTALKFPGSTTTAGWDVNPRGDIVGVYGNASGAHGWIRPAGGEFTTIDVPIAGTTASRVFGINARGDLVGNYANGGKTRGFVARRVH